MTIRRRPWKEHVYGGGAIDIIGEQQPFSARCVHSHDTALAALLVQRDRCRRRG
jgi:hypothetical protein